MVSIGPYSQSYNFTHMFNKGDLRGCLKEPKYCPNSLMDIIDKHPDFTIFKHIINLSGLENILSDKQANFTLFVPSDTQLQGINQNVLVHMDNALARHIVKSSTIDYKIPSALLEDSPASYYLTKDPANKLFITNISGKTYINNDINVIYKDILATNGIIHVVDRLFSPYIV